MTMGEAPLAIKILFAATFTSLTLLFVGAAMATSYIMNFHTIVGAVLSIGAGMLLAVGIITCGGLSVLHAWNCLGGKS